MISRKAARNMQSHNTNKTGIQCICWFYSQGTILYVHLHDEVLSEVSYGMNVYSILVF